MKSDILLIQPPFSMPDKPYISIPTLAAYLKKQGITVRGLDLNIEFFRQFLSPKNLQASKAFTEKRFAELNEQSDLNFLEMSEYSLLVEILREIANVERKLSRLFESYTFSNVEKFFLFRVALKLASVPYFPEMLGMTNNTGYIRYTSKYSRFSSRDILKSLEDTSLYSQHLKGILFPILQQDKPILVGISLTFPDQVFPAFKCAQIIKRWFPDIHLTIGGAFVSCHMREFTNTDLFRVADSFVLDDGEIPLEMLIKELGSSDPNLDNIPGLVYLSNGKIVKNEPATPINMQELPAPDYSIFPLDRYLIKRSSMALLFRLSRGCYWAKCTFCKTQLPIINCHSQPSSEYLFHQLSTVIEQTGVRIISFSDDAASPEILEDISRRLIAAQIEIKWVVSLRFDKRLTIERLQLYKKAGCHSIYFGLESYNPRVLKLMRKGISEALVEQILSNLSQVGISAGIYMIVGFPTETEEEARKSYQKILKLKDLGLIKHCIYNVFELAPYSIISSDPDKFGITKIYTKEGADLMPPVSRFESKKGMNRKQAFQLLALFGENPRDTPGNNVPQPTLTKVMCGKNIIDLNFSPEQIQQNIMEVVSTSGGDVTSMRHLTMGR